MTLDFIERHETIEKYSVYKIGWHKISCQILHISNSNPTRSLNLRTAALERRLYLFRANKRRSLAFGTPHRGATPFVCPLRFVI